LTLVERLYISNFILLYFCLPIHFSLSLGWLTNILVIKFETTTNEVDTGRFRKTSLHCKAYCGMYKAEMTSFFTLSQDYVSNVHMFDALVKPYNEI